VANEDRRRNFENRNYCDNILTMNKIEIYTDGSCLGNPGPGGWGVIILDGDSLSGGEPETTNNRMEMTAIIKALEWVRKNAEAERSKDTTTDTPKEKHDTLIMSSNLNNCKITIYSDSNLIIQTLNQSWKRKANLDLWAQIDKLRAWLNISWVWVKAHNTNKNNNKVDKLAFNAARKFKKPRNL